MRANNDEAKVNIEHIFPNISRVGLANTGFLFGAGTSFEAGYPLCDKITQEVIGALSKNEINTLVVLLRKHNLLKSTKYTILEPPDIEALLNLVIYYRLIEGSSSLSLLEEAIKDNLVKILLSIKDIDISSHIKFLTSIKNWMSERANPFWLFTTNYDMLFELATMEAKMPLRNGFEGSCARYFDIDRIALKQGHINSKGYFEPYKEPHMKLIKLHGSISWYQKDNNVYEIFHDIPSSMDYKRVMVLPKREKVMETLSSPYDRLFTYSKQVIGSKCTFLVTCGYSYRDQHINENLLIPRLREGKIRIFALFDQEPSCIEKFKEFKGFNYLSKEKLFVNGRETKCKSDLWKFSEFVEFIST